MSFLILFTGIASVEDRSHCPNATTGFCTCQTNGKYLMLKFTLIGGMGLGRTLTKLPFTPFTW
jgi:hypothetical protein